MMGQDGVVDDIKSRINGAISAVDSKGPFDNIDCETFEEGCVLIAGGGPVGLLLAIVLAHYGVRSVILERNFQTTRSAPNWS